MPNDERPEHIGAVMRAYIDAARSGDWERAFTFFAEDITFRIPGRSRFAGEHRGRQAAIDYIETARGIAHQGDVTGEPIDTLERRARVALLLRERFRLDDREVEIRRSNVYRIQDGKIVEIWIFEADQYDVDALFA